ncbi:MAG: periplasmic heavy metal sensor [Nitrospirae bacterium]|nr:periplasmic heavy metal sensor [Nitrospirota bacterium]
MKKVYVLLFASVLMLGWIAASEAKMHGKKMGKGRGMGMGMMAMHDEGGMHQMMEHIMSLGLDGKQRQEIRTIHLQCKKETIRKKADIEVAEIELREILGKDAVDIKAAEAKVKQIEALKSDMKMLHIRTHEEIKARLTPEQRKKLAEMMEKMPMAGMGMMQGRGMMGGGMGMMGGKCDKCRMMQGMDDDDKKAPPASSGHQH